MFAKAALKGAAFVFPLQKGRKITEFATYIL